MSKRNKSGNSKSASPSKKKKTVRAEPFQWGSAGCYTKFISECKTESEAGRNVFSSGEAKDNVATKMSQQYPNCSREVIRQKLRQQSVIADLEVAGIIRI